MRDLEPLDMEGRLGWVPQLFRHSGGAVWCGECDQPFMVCGSVVHNRDHWQEMVSVNPFTEG